MMMKRVMKKHPRENKLTNFFVEVTVYVAEVHISEYANETKIIHVSGKSERQYIRSLLNIISTKVRFSLPNFWMNVRYIRMHRRSFQRMPKKCKNWTLTWFLAGFIDITQNNQQTRK